MTTTKTNKFNARTADLTEFNRELKRLASAKCLTKQALKVETDEAKKNELQSKLGKILADYDKVSKAKAKKFPKPKTYMDYTEADIAELDLKKTMAGIASLACKRSRYPQTAAEVKKVEAMFQAHKAKLQGMAEAREVLKGLSKDEIEELLANAQ